MSKKIDPRSSPLHPFLASGNSIPAAVREYIGPTLNHLDGKTPSQRAAVLDTSSPEHAALLAYLSTKLGRPVERVNMEMLKVLKDITL
jgi:hypothetical protein